MNKVIFIILLLITANCSLDTRSGLWTKNKDLKSEENKKIKKLFLKKNTNTSEFNRDIKVKFQKNSKNIRSFSNDNNNGLIDYQGNLENVSKYKFSKINRFNEFDPEFIFKDDNIIFLIIRVQL